MEYVDEVCNQTGFNHHFVSVPVPVPVSDKDDDDDDDDDDDGGDDDDEAMTIYKGNQPCMANTSKYTNIPVQTIAYLCMPV